MALQDNALQKQMPTLRDDLMRLAERATNDAEALDRICHDIQRLVRGPHPEAGEAKQPTDIGPQSLFDGLAYFSRALERIELTLGHLSQVRDDLAPSTSQSLPLSGVSGGMTPPMPVPGFYPNANTEARRW